jgi:DNA-directed RNA polymerase specialized sigma24 family protein
MPATVLDQIHAGASAPEVEAAARAVRPHLRPEERTQLNEALLLLLAEEKARLLPAGRSYQDLLRDKDSRASILVNALVLLNEGLLREVAARVQKRWHLPGRPDELLSTALTGRPSAHGKVHGMMGAILHYDLAAYGPEAFGTYLTLAMANAFKPNSRERRNRAAERERREAADERRWVDRLGPPPEQRAQDDELLQAVQASIQALPAARSRALLEYVVGRALATGRRPRLEEIGGVLGVSTERARQLSVRAFDELRQQLAQHYPQLAADGVNGWDQFQRLLAGPPPRKRPPATEGGARPAASPSNSI